MDNTCSGISVWVVKHNVPSAAYWILKTQSFITSEREQGNSHFLISCSAMLLSSWKLHLLYQSSLADNMSSHVQLIKWQYEFKPVYTAPLEVCCSSRATITQAWWNTAVRIFCQVTNSWKKWIFMKGLDVGGREGAGAIPGIFGRGIHPGQLASPSQSTHTIHSHPKDN